MLGDRFILLLMAQYLLAALLYLWQGHYWKMLYWLSALGISVAVLKMR